MPKHAGTLDDAAFMIFAHVALVSDLMDFMIGKGAMQRVEAYDFMMSHAQAVSRAGEIVGLQESAEKLATGLEAMASESFAS